MSKKLKLPKGVKGYGYVGVWIDPKNTLGWFVSPFVSGKGDRKYPSSANDTNLKGERLYLCKIKIKPLLDKKNRPITKIVK